MSTMDVIDDTSHIPADLLPVMKALALVGRDLGRTIKRGPLGGSLGVGVGENLGGDQQKALDVMADDAFAAELKKTPVRYYASEEQDEVVELNPAGTFALAIDPLDGSSNIDVNVSIGTIFSVFEAKADDPLGSFLRPADEQRAGGYIIYGPQTFIVVTFGDGVQSYLLEPDSNAWMLVETEHKVPPQASEFAINASNYRHWSPAIRAYIDDMLAGSSRR